MAQTVSGSAFSEKLTEARRLVRNNIHDFSVAGSQLAQLFSEDFARRVLALDSPSPSQILLRRIDLARQAATLPDYRPDPECPESSWLDFECNGPLGQQQSAARMVVLAILIAADFRSPEVITPSVCELASIHMENDSAAHEGIDLIDWSEPGWPNNQSPSPRVLGRLSNALQLLSSNDSISTPIWKWNQDGTLSTDLSRATPSNLIPEVLRLADNLLSIIESMDPTGEDGKVIGDRKRSFATALHKLNTLGAAAVLPLYRDTWREARGSGLAVSTSVPSFEYDELARALLTLCMTPLGAYGHDQLIEGERISVEQISKLERNRKLVADLAQPLLDHSRLDAGSLKQVTARQRQSEEFTTVKTGQQPHRLKKSHLRAGDSLRWAERERPDIVARFDAVILQREALFEHIRESGDCPAYSDEYPCPTDFETWNRYVRYYLQAVDGTFGLKPGEPTRSMTQSKRTDGRKSGGR